MEAIASLAHEYTPDSAWGHLDRVGVDRVVGELVQRGRVSADVASAAIAKSIDRSTAEKGAVVDVPEASFNRFEDEAAVARVAGEIFEHLVHGGSLFSDDNVWTPEAVQELVKRFVDRPNISGDNFLEKLTRQMEGASDDTVLLFAEVYLLQLLPLSHITKARKVANIESVLSLARDTYSIPEYVLSAFDSPIFSGGPAFGARRFQHLSLLIYFARYILAMEPIEREAALRDPLRWRDVVQDAPGTAEPALRNSLLYLAHPETFYPVVAQRHKERIVAKFFPAYTKTRASGDLDEDLATLTELFESPPGSRPDFYVEPLKSIWDPAPSDAEPDGPNTSENAIDGTSTEDVAVYTVETIAADGGFHDPELLHRIIKRWQETRNIVLQGAPGTGKTWLARRLAYALIGRRDEQAVRSVQFHAGTSYEDFVRGWRPGADGRLSLVDGPLMQHAQRAAESSDTPHVLIIEEFNRGNPAQALGEMLTLLESSKRSDADALELTYMKPGEAPVFLPENLYVIGTMNTADRSLALVDFALRRRFAFFSLRPALSDAWQKHLEKRFPQAGPEVISLVRDRVQELNVAIIEDRQLGMDFQLGHSYFTPGKEATDLSPWFRDVVETEVAPQLREYWPQDEAHVEALIKQLLRGL